MLILCRALNVLLTVGMDGRMDDGWTDEQIWTGSSYLFAMVETLVVVLEQRGALLLAGCVVGVGVDDVAGQHLLPEGKATTGTCQRDGLLVIGALGLELIAAWDGNVHGARVGNVYGVATGLGRPGTVLDGGWRMEDGWVDGWRLDALRWKWNECVPPVKPYPEDMVLFVVMCLGVESWVSQLSSRIQQVLQ